jgi:hypothetical protein
MNPIEKNTLLNKIEIEIQNLATLKDAAFKKCMRTHAAKDHREWDRLNAKMEGVFLCRHLILESDCVEAYQERTNQDLSQRTIDIVVSDRTE